AGYAEAILNESVGIPLPELHLRNAGLALVDCRKPEQVSGQRRSGSIVGSVIRGVAVGELIVAAILEESPHGPNEAAIARAELQAVASFLPAEGIARFPDCVPGFHRGGRIVVTHGRIAMHVEERRAKGPGAAKSYALNSELGNDVIGVGVFVETMHREP